MIQHEEDFLLSDEEFDALSPEDQERYLTLVGAELQRWTLHPRQHEAEDMSHACDETLFGGSAGPGKSEWLLYHVDKLSRDVPGHASLVLRSAFPELRRSLMRRAFTRLLYDDERCGRPKWRAADKEWHYPNGSVIEFGYCESDDDVGQYLSAEYDCVGFDELTEFSEYAYNMIRSRARTTRSKKRLGARPHVVGASNPGRRGHTWVKNLFVVGTEYGAQPYEVETALPTGEIAKRKIGFVHSTVKDNPSMDPRYIENLMTLPETLRRQYLEGDWDVFEGMYFPEFQRASTLATGDVIPWHVIEPFEIPYDWPRFCGTDYGYTAPFCNLWLASDQDGYLYVYRELYQTGLTPHEQAEMMRKRSLSYDDGQTRREKIGYVKADPACWSNTGIGLSIASQWAQKDWMAQKANNDRLAGWARVREWLREDAVGSPGIRIFESCPNLIREFTEAIHDPNKPEDLDTDGSDHALDALRYALQSRPRKFKPKATDGPAVGTIEWKMQKHIEKLAKKRKKAPTQF